MVTENVIQIIAFTQVYSQDVIVEFSLRSLVSIYHDTISCLYIYSLAHSQACYQLDQNQITYVKSLLWVFPHGYT
jgi:hypothetical protein